jgi:hypothetical protein
MVKVKVEFKVEVKDEDENTVMLLGLVTHHMDCDS